MEKGNEIKTVVPALRFPEFTNMGNWKIEILSNISSNIFDGIHQTPKYVNEGIPFYSVENIVSNKNNKYISEKDYLLYSSTNKVEKGDILISRIGTIGKSVVVNWDCRFYIYVTLAAVKKTNKFDSYFLSSFFQSEFYQKEILSRSLLNAVPCKINMEELRKTRILLPEIREQQKIANCLSSLDNLIEATAQKVETLKEHKKGLMQRLFPADGKNVPDLRFPRFQASEKWERKIIQDICNITTGNKNTQDKKENGIYPFFVRSPKVERIDSWSFDGEAILTAGDGVGVGKIFHYYVGKMGVHQRVYLLYDIQCNSKYLYYFFSEFFYERVKKMSAKNSVDSVRKDMISDMPLLLPSSQEQQKIADCLSSLDELIEATSQKVEILKEHKKGLMQQLFPKI